MKRLFTPRNLLIIVVLLAVLIGGTMLFPVALPTILLPAEGLFYIGSFHVTNTLVATLLADITILLIAFLVTRRLKETPSGLQNLIEWFIEGFKGLSEDVAGKANSKRWFPIFITILIFLLVANWWELVPGFDSIGIIEPLEVATEHTNGTVRTGYGLTTVLGMPSLDRAQTVSLTEEQVQEILAEANAHEDEATAHEGEATAESHTSKYGAYVLKPFLRAAATDLNLTIALALIAVVLVQIEGVRALGGSYFRKFFLPKIPGLGGAMGILIGGFVGILELISEFAKIISFSFRLFGNIFAGQILLFVMPFLVTFLLVVPFLGLELFVGFMQAFVFAILTLIFLASAVVSHEGHDDHGHEHAAEASH